MERTACDCDKVAQGGAALPRNMKQILGNSLAGLVVAAMRQGSANLLKRNFHIRRGPFIHIFHERSPTVIRQPNNRQRKRGRHAAEITYVMRCVHFAESRVRELSQLPHLGGALGQS